MDREQVQKALDELKKLPKRKFCQSYDLIINLKNVDLKVNPIEAIAILPSSKGTQVKIAAFVDQELIEQSNQFCDLTIKENEFPKYSDKKTSKKLAEEYDYFISQANLMPRVAAAFGKILGTRGKMPNPKMGCVVPANANLEMLTKKLRSTVRLSARKALNLQCLAGKENQQDDEIISNVLAIYNAVAKQVPQDETQNIKNACLKLTMSKPVKI
ncbi:50S ribosomal protein L1 [Candidatus Woesearchaeota archaeon]|nr:50S ribosomal protein L1 [Candidatus Woesearchaeota archaeon]